MPEDKIVAAAETLLEESNKRLLAERSYTKAILEADFFPRILVNRDGVIIMVNALACKLFDYPETMMVGQLVEILMPERFRLRHVEHRTRFFSHPDRREMGAGMGMALVIKTRYGSEHPVSIGLAPMRMEEGTFVSVTFQEKLPAEPIIIPNLRLDPSKAP